MSADLAVQRAIRACLVASSTVTDLVPAASILDVHKRPSPRPGIVLGDAQTLDAETIGRGRYLVTHTIHVWTEESSTEGAKRIMGAARTALRASRLDLGPGLHCADWRIVSERTLRDPDGVTSHGILALECLVEEVEP